MSELVRFAIAASICCALTPLLIAAGRRGWLVDAPNARSSHKLPTPRAGGLAIVAGFLAASIPGCCSTPGQIAILAGVVIMAGIGFADDVFHLPILPRLCAQAGVAYAVSRLAGRIDVIAVPGLVSIPTDGAASLITIIWIVAVINFFNFMDGIDGLAAGQALITSILFLLLGLPGTTGLAAPLGGAVAAFLLYNWPRAKIFMGDVGSMPIGLLLASLPLTAGSAHRADALFVAAISMTLFLVDPTVTLIRRIYRGQRVGESHRDHAYQQFVRPGDSHLRATSALLLITAILGVIALRVVRVADYGIWAIALAVMAYAVEAILAERRRRMTQLSR